MEYSDYGQLKQMEQIEAMKKKLLGSILTKDAFERLGRVRFANPELAAQAELYLLQVYQAGKMAGTVTDAQMVEILKLLTSEKRDFSIKRRKSGDE
jgi:DNA-binding TFAR19-related protein (PDSD5 family)